MREWLTTAEVADALSTSKRTVQLIAKREAWPARPRSGRGGGLEYHLSCLPPDVRAALSPAGVQAADVVRLKHDAHRQVQHTTLQAGLRDVQGLTGSEQQRLNARLDIYHAWQQFRKHTGLAVVESQYRFAERYNDQAVPVEMDTRRLYPTITRGSLARWSSQLRKQGVKRLAGTYRKRRSLIESQPELKQFLESVIVTYPHITARTLGEGMRARFCDRNDFTLPGQRAVDRWLTGWKKQHAQVFTAIANPDKWKNDFKAAFGSESAHVVRLNQEWEFDATPADLLLSDGRYSLSGVIDVYSRRLKLFVTRTPKAEAVAALLRRAVLDWGVPEVAKIDNGKEYVGHHTTRALTGLGVDVDLSPPFSPWKKSHIERVFRTFSHGLLELLPGYIGHNVADRKELEARRSFADRLFKKNAAIDIKMSAKDFQIWCDRWCEIYHREQHGGLNGRTPLETAAAWAGEVRRISDERALDLLLSAAPDNHGRRTVSKKGIRIKWPHEPASHYYIAPELGLHVREQVTVLYDPAGDMGRIYVFGDDGFICIAENPQLAGIDQQEHAEAATRQQRAIQQERRSRKALARTENVGSLADEIMSHKERQRGNVALFQRAGTEHTSQFLTEAAEAARVAESLDTPATAPPVSQAAMDKVARLLQDPEPEETAEDRFRRAMTLRDGTRQGTAAEYDWLAVYETSSEFRGRYLVWRSLGEGAEREDLDDDPLLPPLRHHAG